MRLPGFLLTAWLTSLFVAGQDIFFYLNHPIRFVRIVAPIVAIDDISSALTLLTLDDGSGATVDVKITRVVPPKPNPNQNTPDIITDSTDNSLTTVHNLTVISQPGIFTLLVDGTHALDIGTVIKVKCTISTFRYTRQLDLHRISIVRDTDAEVAAWAELAQFRRNVLLRPWHLRTEEMRRLMDERDANARRAVEEQRRMREKQVRRREKRVRWEEKKREYEEKKERRRRKEEIMFNAGALI